MVLAILVGVAGASVGAWLIAWWAIERGLRPLTSLADELGRTRASDPHIDASPVYETEELAPITFALNALLARVHATVARERRFTDAAAHELRTPLAELRAICDVAARFPDTDRLSRGMLEVNAIGQEMSSLLEALLLATRGEHAAEKEPTTVSIAVHVHAAMERRAIDIRERGIESDLRLDETASWIAAPGVVEIIVRNLIDNAIQYTPQGGAVSIRVTSDAHGAILEIRNGPVDIRRDQLGSVFEPFWRADASRSDHERRGLGLSIVAAMAEATGLRCRVELTDDQVFALTIEPDDHA
jgi:two-component system sensor histidine kinase QseC